MRIIVQFLEGGPASAGCPPAEARRMLREAFARLPIEAVLLGWNLPPALVEACAEECRRAQADLYLWHPLLSGDGVFLPRPEWRTVGWDGTRIADPRGRDEFTFVCPNRADVRAGSPPASGRCALCRILPRRFSRPDPFSLAGGGSRRKPGMLLRSVRRAGAILGRGLDAGSEDFIRPASKPGRQAKDRPILAFPACRIGRLARG